MTARVDEQLEKERKERTRLSTIRRIVKAQGSTLEKEIKERAQEGRNSTTIAFLLRDRVDTDRAREYVNQVFLELVKETLDGDFEVRYNVDPISRIMNITVCWEVPEWKVSPL